MVRSPSEAGSSTERSETLVPQVSHAPSTVAFTKVAGSAVWQESQQTHLRRRVEEATPGEVAKATLACGAAGSLRSPTQ